MRTSHFRRLYSSWQKEFGLKQINGKALKSILESKEHKNDIVESGMPVRAGLPSANLLYLKWFKILDKRKGNLRFYTLGDYIIRCLSGKNPLCHITNAAATGLVNLTTKQWNKDLIEVVSNHCVIFPDIGTDGIESVINNCHFLFLPAIGDQQAALYGAGLNKKDDISFNLGTGAQVSKIIDKIQFSSCYQIRPYVNGLFIKSIPHLPSGRALNVYIRLLKDVLNSFGLINIEEDMIWKRVIEDASNDNEMRISCDLSFFENPISPKIVGSIENIPEYGLTIGSLFRAIFNQMTTNFLWAANMIEPQKENISRIVFSGGVAKRIDYIRSKIIEEYNGAVVQVAPDNETLYGLYYYVIDFIGRIENEK